MQRLHHGLEAKVVKRGLADQGNEMIFAALQSDPILRHGEILPCALIKQ
jgi:hypothetical protein